MINDTASRCPCAGIADGLRRVKLLPATSGHEGTTMGFGVFDHAALKGAYLVLREWRDGHSVQIETTAQRPQRAKRGVDP